MEKPQYSTKKSHSDQNQDLFFVMTYFNHKHFASVYSEYLMKDYANRLVPSKKHLVYSTIFPKWSSSSMMQESIL